MKYGKVIGMNKKVKSVLSLVLSVIMVFSCFVNVLAEDELTAYEKMMMKNDIANFVINLSNSYYYGVEDVDLLYRALCSCIDLGYYDYDAAIENMMGLLTDEYSEYYTADRFRDVYTNITGEFYGIGVTITLSKEHVVVVSVFPDSPAEKSGILPYDIITSIDGKDISGMSTGDVANLIKREKGNRVELGIERNGRAMTVVSYSDEVNQNPVSYEIMDGKIGYVYISGFSMNLDEFIVPVLKEFEEKGIKDIILDIRNNGGGELNAAIKLAEHFVPEGVITKLKYRNPEKNQDITVENNMTKSPYNLVVLVNENSASASELFTGAVKDRNAGVVIGTTTYGKGSMQSIFTLKTGSAVKYTVAEFHSPNDTRIHTVGIAPDFVVENSTYTVNEAEFQPIDFKKQGDITQGNHILAIEERLDALGCFEGEPDMVFDDATREGIRYLQMIKNLEITGNPDVYTLVALNDIVYDFEIANDDQIVAAKNYLLTGKIN